VYVKYFLTKKEHALAKNGKQEDKADYSIRDNDRHHKTHRIINKQ